MFCAVVQSVVQSVFPTIPTLTVIKACHTCEMKGAKADKTNRVGFFDPHPIGFKVVRLGRVPSGRMRFF